MKEKQFLVFYVGDGSSRESYNAYYAVLVNAPSAKLAKDKYLANENTPFYIEEATHKDIDAVLITDKNHIK